MQEKWGEKYRVSIQQSHTQAILTLDNVTEANAQAAVKEIVLRVSGKDGMLYVRSCP